VPIDVGRQAGLMPWLRFTLLTGMQIPAIAQRLLLWFELIVVPLVEGIHA
jgi:hypothetical protein